MKRLILIALLLCASTADAQKIGLIGDSHVRGGVTFGSDSYVSRWRMAVTLRALVSADSGGTVVDYSIPGTGMEDYLEHGPSSAAHCTGADSPWCCCTGEGAGSGCACDGPLPTFYPNLKAACRDRRPVTEYLPTDVDLWILQADGSQCTTADEDVAKAVDQAEELRDALDAIGGDVMLVTPAPVTGQCIALASIHEAIRNEMVTRGIITGPDFFDFPASRICPDLVHFGDMDWPITADGSSITAIIFFLTSDAFTPGSKGHGPCVLDSQDANTKSAATTVARSSLMT